MEESKITRIRKRDDSIVPFEEGKIVKAIISAANATKEIPDETRALEFAQKIKEKVIKSLNERFHERSIPAVEEVQDIVEEELIKSRFIQTAKSYILYRDQHARIREMQATLIDSDDLIDGYLKQVDWRVKENSNMAYSLQGLNNHVASAVSSHYWLNKIYPKEVREAHLEADLHLHDLQILAAYCCGWDLKELLMRGFGGASGKIESGPAKHFRVALGQIVNFFYTLQGETAGAQAFSSFDVLLAPFIRYDKMGYQEVKQCLQEFLFNMNVPTRVGFQSPFTNITMDLAPSSYMADEGVIVGGVPQKETYKEFQPEIDLLNRAFAEVMLAGDAKGRVFTFPIPTYNITNDFNWENPVLEPIWEMTAKYGVPYFCNFVNSDMKPEDVRSMCPLAGEEKVLIKSSRGRQLEYSGIRNIYEGNGHNDEYEIYSDGVAANQDGKMQELKGEELAVGMYLPYSLNSYVGSGGTRDLGYFVGAYAGDGSFDGETTVVFSLENQRKKEVIKKLIKIAQDNFGAHYSTYSPSDSQLFSLKIHSRAAVGLCKDFVAGKKREKYYQAKVYGTSRDFRQGLIEGHYATDGGNRHRIYTSSRKMVETLNMLAATLGTTTSVYDDNRSGRFGQEPNYAVLIYQLNRKKYGQFWFKSQNKLWIRIKSIENVGQ
ncbi:MAG: ribonucleoside triphosphate reductase, partial [Candidatus Magasanikbacteria bacterium]|nr:ribonucleoside triphosphate reductase [Candidatus Magasanikbacteria bacterium]